MEKKHIISLGFTAHFNRFSGRAAAVQFLLFPTMGIIMRPAAIGKKKMYKWAGIIRRGI